jgi:hypothetical protein
LVELDYSVDLGVLCEQDIETLVEIEDALDAAVVGQDPERGLSVSLEVDAATVSEALAAAERNTAAALLDHGLYTDRVGAVTTGRVQTLAAFQAEQAQPSYPELVSSAEAADVLGVSRQRVHQLYRERPDFPTPLYELRTGPLWVRGGIEAFADRWTRKPGRPRNGERLGA